MVWAFMLMGESLMAPDWVLCAGPLMLKAIWELNMHCTHLAALWQPWPHFKKPACPQLISRTHNGQTSIRAAAVPQENMLKTLQWDQAILCLFASSKISDLSQQRRSKYVMENWMPLPQMESSGSTGCFLSNCQHSSINLFSKALAKI